MTLCCPCVVVRPVDALLLCLSMCLCVCFGEEGALSKAGAETEPEKADPCVCSREQEVSCPHLPPVGYKSNMRAVVTPVGGPLLTKKLKEKMGLILICNGKG